MRPLLPQVRKTMFGRTTLRSQRDLVSEWSERFAQVDVPSALQMLAALKRRRDLHHRFPSIQAPALVVVGEEDVSLPPERSCRLAAALPRSRFVEVPEAGHVSALERPSLVTDVMLDFLRELD